MERQQILPSTKQSSKPAPVSDLNIPLSNVTFEMAFRNNWHNHIGGQLLIVMGGEGLYQERGKPARSLKAGDVIDVARNVQD